MHQDALTPKSLTNCIYKDPISKQGQSQVLGGHKFGGTLLKPPQTPLEGKLLWPHHLSAGAGASCSRSQFQPRFPSLLTGGALRGSPTEERSSVSSASIMPELEKSPEKLLVTACTLTEPLLVGAWMRTQATLTTVCQP